MSDLGVVGPMSSTRRKRAEEFHARSVECPLVITKSVIEILLTDLCRIPVEECR